jgi:hypothetical protein
VKISLSGEDVINRPPLIQGQHKVQGSTHLSASEHFIKLKLGQNSGDVQIVRLVRGGGGGYDFRLNSR